MCKPVIFTLLILTGLSASVLQTVLVLRTYALWDRSKWIFWFLMTLNVSASIAQQGLIMNIWGKRGLDIIYNPLPAPYTGCLVDFKLGTWERYVPTLVFELGVVFFLLVKFVAYIFQGRSNRVLYILFRDGFIEFTAVTLFSIFSLLLGIVGPKNSDVVDLITFDLSASISVICCARMLLNIRDVMTLSDPLDTTKPNPWSLDDSFDERYGIDRHTVIAPPETSRVEMFESFFGNSERATHMTSVPSEQAEATSPVVSNHAPSRDPVDIKGKGVSREPADMGSNEGLEDRA
ncbi:hypothetical protein DL93DRAFT_1697665 [Clavulina sp. PMI_390]|nr:hypothetical protein DL93DRAFT_1697665 [Clavulina sp. PMI_390]